MINVPTNQTQYLSRKQTPANARNNLYKSEDIVLREANTKENKALINVVWVLTSIKNTKLV